MIVAVKTRSLVQRRMYAQMLWGARPAKPEDVVARLGAVQAQELRVARWSIGQRCRRTSSRAIDEALAEGSILRTHVLRPTWHFVLPRDLRWMLRLTGPRVAAKMAYYDRTLELDAKVYARSNKVIAKAVTDGHRTRPELGAALSNAGIQARGQRLNHIVMRAELDAIICSGAPRGKQQTYAALDDRAPAGRSTQPPEPLVELARRYFTSHGPATVKDFVWWSGLTKSLASEALSALEGTLAHELDGGRTYWSDPSVSSVPERSNAVDLVQIYDEIGIAYTESRDLLLSAGGQRAAGGAITHALLLDGRYAGEWRTSASSGWREVSASFRRGVTRLQRGALGEAIERYRRFMTAPGG